MSHAHYIVGDTRSVLSTLPDNSVDLVLSSPPFLALRSYLPADHPDKALEMGSEATPADFLDGLLDVVEACDRVLAPHGSLVFELGDTYAGSGGGGGDYAGEGMRNGQPRWDGSASRTRADGNGKVFRGGARQPDKAGLGWPLDKSLCGIPTLFAWSLAYGRNLLRPERTTAPWRVRNLVAWCRPNPPVGALGDKVRPATSYLTVACKARDRYFDLDAVRTPGSRPSTGKTADDDRRGGNFSTLDTLHDTAGAPPLDHWWHDDTFDQDAWLIPTQAYSEAHYATWPEALCVTPIKAMCPLRVCRVCGKPARRITEITRVADKDNSQRRTDAGTYRLNGHDHPPEKGWEMSHRTLGWTDCGHDDWRPGVVLDPFGGSGTTGAVATGHGRDAILIDLDERNAELAQQRIGPLMCTVGRRWDFNLNPTDGVAS